MNNTINCPYCGEEIPASSTSCPYCGERLNQMRSDDRFPAGIPAEDHPSVSPVQDSRSHIAESDSKHESSPKVDSESPETLKTGKLVAIIVAASVVIGVTFGLVIGVSKNRTPAHKDNIPSAVYQSGNSSAQSTAKAKTPAPSATPVSTAATFYCANTKEEVAFDYGYDPYAYGDYVLLSGDCGALGGYSGYNVVSYQKSTGTYNYVCFGAEVIVYSPLVISLGRRIVKEGDCEADNEYTYVYEYYSGTTNRQMASQVYSGTIGKYKITMELAFDTVTPKAIGTYYYSRNGGRNRMIVFGDVAGDGDLLVLKAYDTNFYDKPSETMVLNATGSGFSGYWERPNKNRLEVNLSR